MNRQLNNRAANISIVTLFAVLALVVLIGFVGSTGQAVHRKIETQNAADNAALSSAQWMARGMNSITATNHMIGEVTAISTIHQSLGGPELDAGIETTTIESDLLDRINGILVRLAPIRGLPTYVPDPLTEADETFLNFVVGQVSPGNENHRAFATIYDAKMTLKKELAKQLLIKSFANLGFLVPPPWGYIPAAGAYVAHGYATKKIFDLTVERFYLRAIEEVAVQTKTIKVNEIEKRLVPELVNHAEVMAGLQANAPGSLTDRLPSGNLVGHSIQDELDHIGNNTGINVASFPRPSNIRLPVEAEPGPTMRGGQNEPEWQTDSAEFDLGLDLNSLLNDSQKRKNNMRRRIERNQRDIQDLERQQTEVNTLSATAVQNSKAAWELRNELNEIEALTVQKRERIEKSLTQLAEIERQEEKLRFSFNQLSEVLTGRGGNLSEQHLPVRFLNQRQERSTQWVCATYPNVDALRAPILSQFKNRLSISQASQHFTKWSNRYTLIKSWEFRSGYRFRKTGSRSGEWSRSTSAEPLSMLVMTESYDRNGIVRKGDEPWTRTDNTGRQQAERLFTVIGLGHRKNESLFSPVIYPAPHQRGITTYAQAILYNANPQSSAPVGPSQADQHKTGWDTLNWSPEFVTPQWGSGPTMGESKWPWEVFSEARRIDSIRVKLNWQAKLMPATRSRLSEAAKDSTETAMGPDLGFSVLQFEGMSSH